MMMIFGLRLNPCPRIGLILAAAVASHAVHATTPPTGGQLLQEVPPRAPAGNLNAPVLVIDRPDAAAIAPGEAFLVRRIEVTGFALVSAEQVRSIVAPSEGKMLTLADLQKLAQAITALYQRTGYPYSQAYIPTQTLQDGKVRIAVLEARYDGVVLRNSSRVLDYVPDAVLSALKPGMPVGQAELDRVLLLVSDIPGTEVKGTLRPGKTPGASELLVDVDPGPEASGSVAVDDYGNAATGRWRLNGSINVNNPLRAGDVLSASALTAGKGTNYGRLGYTLPVYGPATQLEAHVYTLGYHLENGAAAALDSHGTATVAGGGVQQILLRATGANVTAALTYDHTQLRDDVDVSDIRTHRHTEELRASVTGSFNNQSGVTGISAGLTAGRLMFDDPSAALVDASGAHSAGTFNKFVFSLSRLQALNSTTALYAQVTLQAADRNLDISEQFFIGGPSTVRAYDNGVLSGTQGNLQSLELRHDLANGPYGRFQGTVFLEHAQVQIDRTPYGSGPNSGNLSGGGVGFNWVIAGGWSVVSSIATPIGGTPEVAGHRDAIRAWLQAQKAF